ncbi:MAG: hypothetical protein LC797_14655 [Chloroflexi bacterium]|nr:hypothetical protein [Chloroflexota bacterium]
MSLSSDVAAEIREYWRASTTVVNAYIAPVVARYLTGIEQRLERASFRRDIHVMQPNGGVTSADQANGRRNTEPSRSVERSGLVCLELHRVSVDCGGCPP